LFKDRKKGRERVRRWEMVVGRERKKGVEKNEEGREETMRG